MKDRPSVALPAPSRPRRTLWWREAACLVGLVYFFILLRGSALRFPWRHHQHDAYNSAYHRFPDQNDPLHLMPCTNITLLPALEDAHPEQSWGKLFDPEPNHWSWGKQTSKDTASHGEDPYDGRGIYLCGYLDVPLDYTNNSDPRIVRLAITKYQVSGLARRDGGSHLSSGKKSERTLVIEPGGTGGSGTLMAWTRSELESNRLTDGQFDVLGWDPRGVNASLPAISCFPYDVDRDRWSLRAGQYREVSPRPRTQLEFADAMNDAIFSACKEVYGDLPRFLSTAFVARDLEQIRIALGEDVLTGYLVSYGTGIAQTYAGMFPDTVGRMILDGTEFVPDHRLLGGFGWTSLDNVTDAWHDGFLGECISAGPDQCMLAKSFGGNKTTLISLEHRMESLMASIRERPIPAYSEASGPSLVTYSELTSMIYSCLYKPRTWKGLAEVLFELESGNSGPAATLLDANMWEYDPTHPSPPGRRPASDELGILVICADAYDAPLPEDGLDWWESLWTNMTEQSWLSGNDRFYDVLPCRQFTKYWPEQAEVYRGSLNETLRNPMLLIAEAYDPATPLRNGRRLLKAMGRNARLIAHHGYGHGSGDRSSCTETIARAYMMNGTLPKEQETACFADEKPYLSGLGNDTAADLQLWRDRSF